jgi:hypothetical protein
MIFRLWSIFFVGWCHLNWIALIDHGRLGHSVGHIGINSLIKVYFVLVLLDDLFGIRLRYLLLLYDLFGQPRIQVVHVYHRSR